MKKVVWSVVFTLWCGMAWGQLTIDDCWRKARENYPLIKQYALIEKSGRYDLANAARGYLPQLTVSGKASYQSDVTKIPVSLPGIEIEGLTRDQYQTMVDLYQTLWDGGVIRSQKAVTRAAHSVEKEKLDVDMYALNERVNNLFFGILLLEEQLKQNELLDKELQLNYDKISSYIANGIANQADLDAVKVNQLNSSQRRVELAATSDAYRRMLSALIGMPVRSNAELVKPSCEKVSAGQDILRPELSLFEAQKNQLEQQKKMLLSKNLPKFGLFFQGGYSKPGLNMLKNDFSPYYVAGVKMSWSLSGFYTQKNDRRLIDLDQQNIVVQKETFLFNTGLQATQQQTEIDKLKELMRNDDEIVRLRTNIKNSAGAKVANGTLSVTELLREIHEEDLARQNMALHEIQLLMAIYNLKYTTNN